MASPIHDPFDESCLTFDLKNVIDQTGLEMDEYLEIYELFQECFGELMNDIKNARAEGDPDKIMEAAHTLKGASSNIGFDDLADLARVIQEDPGNTELVDATIPMIYDLYEQLDQDVQAIAKQQP